MNSIHIRIPSLVLDRIDRWAESHAVDRSTAIRSLITQGLDTDSLVLTIETAIAEKEIGLSKRQIADLGTSLAYAVMSGIGKLPDEISPVLKAVREALLQ